MGPPAPVPGGKQIITIRRKPKPGAVEAAPGLSRPSSMPAHMHGKSPVSSTPIPIVIPDEKEEARLRAEAARRRREIEEKIAKDAEIEAQQKREAEEKRLREEVIGGYELDRKNAELLDAEYRAQLEQDRLIELSKQREE
jgi:hypothetical protein